jgi:tetratricopeptide (TPR) repeat protein
MTRVLEGILQALLRGVGAPVCHLAGLVWLRLNAAPRAQVAFERVLDISPNHFGACMGLGRALLVLEEFDQAALAFQRARRIDPIRFDATREAMFLAQEREALKQLEEDDDDSGIEKDTYLKLPAPYDVPRPRIVADGIARKHPRSNTKAFRFKDYASYEEYRRLESRARISREDIAEIDWDRLLDQLSRC